MPHKPFSPACERNQDAILAVLRARFEARTQVLEIGSGTGQHAVHFARALPRLTWQTSDVANHLPGIRQWLADAGLTNTPPPLIFDINGTPPAGRFDAVYSANTLHIMGWEEVQRLFALLPSLMTDGALLTVYGPSTTAARSPVRATPRSTPRCAPTTRSVASATSRRSMRWREPPASN